MQEYCCLAIEETSKVCGSISAIDIYASKLSLDITVNPYLPTQKFLWIKASAKTLKCELQQSTKTAEIFFFIVMMKKTALSQSDARYTSNFMRPCKTF